MAKTAIAGTALQLLAVGALARGGGTATLLAFVALQTVASALLALPLSWLLSRRMHAPWRSSFAYLFVLGAFVPLGGVLICLASLALARLARGGADAGGIGTIGLPGAGTAALLSPSDERQHGAGAHDVDARRLAHGAQDAAETRLMEQIAIEQDRLAVAGDAPTPRATIHQRLAQLYWELVYQRLVQGDVRSYSLQQAEHHVDEALHLLLVGAGERHDGRDEHDDGMEAARVDNVAAALWQLRGRLALASHQPAVARYALECAARLGFSRQRVLPLLAEVAFEERRFAEVPRVLAQLGELPLASSPSLPSLPLFSPSPLRPVLRYWAR